MNDDLRGSAAHVFVLAEELNARAAVAVTADTQHHLTRVLRLRDGETVSVSDGAGRWRLCAVAGARHGLHLEPIGDVVTEPRRHKRLTLATAIPKGDRLDWMVQKCTELGVDHIQLVHTKRSVVRWKADTTDKHVDRLRRISDEAARQSRRVWRVEIGSPIEAQVMLPTAVIAEPGGRALVSTDSVIAIGPEGGWTAEELAYARDHVTLGPNILRTETAAIAAITLSVALSH